MTIKTLEIKGLYGYINKKINFFSDFNLLVGINGSGKTSILNIISWLIKPSIPNLSVLEFQYIKLLLEHNDKTYTILCKHNKTTLKYVLTSNTEESFNPLSVHISVPPKALAADEELKARVLLGYHQLGPDEKEAKTWEFLQSIPNPTIVGLDRNLYTEESERIYLETSIRNKIERKNISKSVSPLIG